jgi:hypothetical protein
MHDDLVLSAPTPLQVCSTWSAVLTACSTCMVASLLLLLLSFSQVFHMERSADSLLNLQNNLPLFSEYDKQAIAALGSEFEVDYVNLAYTRTR